MLYECRGCAVRLRSKLVCEGKGHNEWGCKLSISEGKRSWNEKERNKEKCMLKLKTNR